MSKAAGGKDPFTIFADELTLLRNDIKQLKLSNLSYPEASVINDKITEDVTTFTMAAENWNVLSPMVLPNYSNKFSKTQATLRVRRQAQQLPTAIKRF